MLRITDKRLRANQLNAARSTGPTSPEGKTRSSRNATRHGLLARQILIGDESAGNFQALLDIFLDRFHPVDDFEFNLVEELAASYWRLRRCWALETEILTEAMNRQSAPRQIARLAAAFTSLAASPALPLLHRYETRLHLMYQRALHSLLLLRGIAAPAGAVELPLGLPAASETPHPGIPNEPITAFPSNPITLPHAPQPGRTEGSSPAQTEPEDREALP